MNGNPSQSVSLCQSEFYLDRKISIALFMASHRCLFGVKVYYEGGGYERSE
jgi:hypothetical protein